MLWVEAGEVPYEFRLLFCRVVSASVGLALLYLWAVSPLGEVLQGVDLIAARERPWHHLAISFAGASTGSVFGSAGYLWWCVGVLWSSGAVFMRNRSICSSSMLLRALRGACSVDR